MDIRTLELFHHLAGSLHFSRTSQSCNISPSALTRVIQRLETDVGKQLFIRGNRFVELTYAGQVFKKYAEDVLGRFEQLQGELSKDAILSGQLCLYGSVTAAYSILPSFIPRYRAVHPGVQIYLETGDPAQAIDRLMNRDADAVIAALPEKSGGQISFLNMAVSPLVFIGAKHYPEVLVTDDNGEPDWQKCPLILADKGLSRERIDQWFIENAVVPSIYSQVTGHEAIIALVNLGFGIGLVPRLVLEKSPIYQNIVVLDNMPELPPYEIVLCTRDANLSNPRVRALWDIVAGVS
ncbi:HTH-type transcriptional activator IlvY [uncultured Desulfobacter sp.]|uniref:HTH-type transcriptional activator IlvY n=1 Tax=uncultured Desulfobacter sp. TaxID=240139 RepID=UPI0029F482F3|nr:HTH-type transcriptional activator IlvY [uncultured Desulfobacter sp.]